MEFAAQRVELRLRYLARNFLPTNLAVDLKNLVDRRRKQQRFAEILQPLNFSNRIGIGCAECGAFRFRAGLKMTTCEKTFCWVARLFGGLASRLTASGQDRLLVVVFTKVLGPAVTGAATSPRRIFPLKMI